MQIMQNYASPIMWIIYAVVVWSIPWKGAALWKSARNGHRVWFIVLLLINTAAILDILYIFIFNQNQSEEVKIKEADSNDKDGSNGGPMKRVV
jgi:preprotein translocase subunit SecY